MMRRELWIADAVSWSLNPAHVFYLQYFPSTSRQTASFCSYEYRAAAGLVDGRRMAGTGSFGKNRRRQLKAAEPLQHTSSIFGQRLSSPGMSFGSGVRIAVSRLPSRSHSASTSHSATPHALSRARRCSYGSSGENAKSVPAIRQKAHEHSNGLHMVP